MKVHRRLRRGASTAGMGPPGELAVLRALGSHRVPKPIGVHGHGIVYEHIAGEEFNGDVWLALGASLRTEVAGQLRSILSDLHALSPDILIGELDDLDPGWVRRAIPACASVPARAPLDFDPGALLRRFEQAWSLEDPPMSVVHVDLKPPHLLVNDGRVGIIEFGGNSLGDPALDYGVLVHHLGEGLLRAMAIHDTPLAARARCYADMYILRRCTLGWTRTAPRHLIARAEAQLGR